MCSDDYKMLKSSKDFIDLLFTIQKKRVDGGKEDHRSPASLTKLTKVINNMIKANEKILNSLIEVDIEK